MTYLVDYKLLLLPDGNLLAGIYTGTYGDTPLYRSRDDSESWENLWTMPVADRGVYCLGLTE